ncbi:MAG: hypothetical protein KDA42_09465, partial [Planctomycetales bacterium]|nr:hypothetical protein [Planctomycetales bacterium]
ASWDIGRPAPTASHECEGKLQRTALPIDGNRYRANSPPHRERLDVEAHRLPSGPAVDAALVEAFLTNEMDVHDWLESDACGGDQ